MFLNSYRYLPIFVYNIDQSNETLRMFSKTLNFFTNKGSLKPTPSSQAVLQTSGTRVSYRTSYSVHAALVSFII